MPERTTDAAASEPENPTPETSAPAEALETAASDDPTTQAQPPTEAPEAEPPTEAPAAGEPGADVPQDPTPTEGGTTDPATPAGQMPEYKGEPLDAERGPGLGCFWIQIALLTFFLIFTPLTVTWGWPPIISAALLIFTLILLLFSGQTIIFLLRLVAADRRTRRAPLNPSAKPTVGQMEDVAPEAARETTPGTDDTATQPSAASPADDDDAEPSEERPSDDDDAEPSEERPSDDDAKPSEERPSDG